MSFRRTFWAFLAVLTSICATFAAPSSAHSEDVLVFAAASLKNGLDAAVKAYEAKHGGKIIVSYAATPQLAKQIEAGAPADIFFSADLDWMKRLDEAKLIDSASQVTLLGNRIVLIAPKDSSSAMRIAPGFDLAGQLGDGRLSVANTASVPAGKYARAALQKLGAWDAVANRLAETDNVRAALALVAQGELPLGIVYSTDAAVEPKVTVLDAFPEDSHPPIRYPVASTASSKSLEAKEFFRFLVSPAGAAFFKSQGFTILAPTS